MFDLIQSDRARYRKIDRNCFTELSFWVTTTYRFGHWIDTLPYYTIKNILKVAYFFLVTLWHFFRSVYIPRSVRIGSGFLVFHTQNIFMAGDIDIGNNCTIHHEVTLGTGPKPGLPCIGDNVVLYPGCKILGGVTIGNNVKIGANVVIIRDVPSQTFIPSPISRAIPAVWSKYSGLPH